MKRLIQRALRGESHVRRERTEHVTLLVLLAALNERVLAEHRAHRPSQRLATVNHDEHRAPSPETTLT
jgi:hypothetical protein